MGSFSAKRNKHHDFNFKKIAKNRWGFRIAVISADIGRCRESQVESYFCQKLLVGAPRGRIGMQGKLPSWICFILPGIWDL